MDTINSDLPDSITDYLAAQGEWDVDAAMRTYTGHDEIRAWMGRAAGEYTYTSELTSATRLGDDEFDAVHHLEGNFPGGVVDLHFRFTLRDGLISRLVIEP
jgi:hypothetical protein